MTTDDQPASATLHTLAQQCARETQRFFQNRNDSAFSCLELFRRAIIEQREEAWEYIYQQYENQVRRWVMRHPRFGSTGEAADYFVNLAFTRMWQAMTPDKFRGFDNIKMVLRYLQMCVHSVIVDYLRARPAAAMDIDDINTLGAQTPDAPRVDARVLDRVYQTEVWSLIRTRIRNQKEQIVFYGCYALGMKPSEIYREYPQTFRDVKEIYRIKENILARLRRDKELQAFFAENAGNATV